MPQRWMAVAWALYGVQEAPGKATNATVRALYRDAGHPHVRDDAVPWCAAFVSAVLERAGVPSTRSLRARSYLSWGTAIDGPMLGAIAVLSRGSNPAYGHVGFVVGSTARHVFLLGGNQSDAVTVARFPMSRVLGYRMDRPPSANSRTTETPVPDNAATSQRRDLGDDNNTEDRFAAALQHVLKMEGGYTDDPYDPGGPTNKGITLAMYARNRGISLTEFTRPGLISALKRIDDATVSGIYERRYWTPSRAADMPSGVDLMHFDASVNHGVRGAAKLVQSAVGVSVDGEIGPITMGAISSTSPRDLIAAYARARRTRYRALPHFWRFGRGWLNRVAATEKRALATAAAMPAPHRDLITRQTPSTKPRSDDAMTTSNNTSSSKTDTTKWWGQSMTLWGAFITTMTTVLPVVGPLFGLNLTGAAIEQIGQHVTVILQALGGISGILLTIAGRMRASTQLVTRAGLTSRNV